MKKDFFGGRETESEDTIYAFCDQPRCLDPATCVGCGRPDDPDAAAAGDVSAPEDFAAAAPPPPAKDWGYLADNGPHSWHRQFPVAALGRFQSPIDLREEDLMRGNGGGGPPPLPPLLTCFQSAASLSVENTGASWQINWPRDDAAAACVLRGGPLAGEEYHLLQLHAHWGAEPGRGSEHTLEGRAFEGELHLVFYNIKYLPEEAMEAPDGLAVVGLFLSQAGGDEVTHPELEKITRQLARVRRRGEAAPLDAALAPADLLPPPGVNNNNPTPAYFTYPGSLTAPPLYESVTWIVMREPLALAGRQLDMMRGMRCGEDDASPLLVDNYRPPPCCLGPRPLRAGF